MSWENLSEAEQLITYIGEAHKDVYGIRPTNSTYQELRSLDLPELRNRLSSLSDEIAVINQQNKQYQQSGLPEIMAQQKADLKNEIALQFQYGAKNERQAKRWVQQQIGRA